jgi:hypothetical protein
MAWFFFAGLVVMVGLQLSSGRIATRGRSIERDRNLKGFWIGSRSRSCCCSRSPAEYSAGWRDSRYTARYPPSTITMVPVT